MREVIEYFEDSVRSRGESRDAVRIEVDSLFGFDKSREDSIFSHIVAGYSPDHWAAYKGNFGSFVELAFQQLCFGLDNLRPRRELGGTSFNCCARILNEPSLTPYVLRPPAHPYNYIVIPTGFLSSLEQFVSATYAVASAATSTGKFPKILSEDSDLFLGAIGFFAEDDISTFTNAVVEASRESWLTEILGGYADPLAFVSFDRLLNDKIMEMMPTASSWKRLGYPTLRDALNKHATATHWAQKTAFVAVCYSICHEFGHAFGASVDSNVGEEYLTKHEGFADTIGLQILYRLIETGVIQTLLNEEVAPQDLGHAVVAFHSWNLSTKLSALLARGPAGNVQEQLDFIHQVACRWDAAMSLVQKVWTDTVPSMAHLDGKVTIGSLIVNQWGVMTAGLVRVAVLLRSREVLDMDAACSFLSMLPTRDSRAYELLSGTGR